MSAPTAETPFSTSKIPVLDQDGSHLWFSDPSDAKDLVDRGLARKFGSRRRAIGVILLIALEEHPIEDIEPAKALQTALSLHAYGTRYVFREHLDGRHYIYSFTGFDRGGTTFIVKQKHLQGVLASCGSSFRQSAS